ncbi:MAG: METTL5 family protein [Candidatus Thorarchaeota archaeon]
MSIFSKEFLLFLNSYTQDFFNPKIELEQYSTPTTILEDFFSINFNFNGKKVLDMGSGLGTLSFCVAWLGAKTIIGIESDLRALKKARVTEKMFNEKLIETQNKNRITKSLPNFFWINTHLEFFILKKLKNFIDIVIMNPPFGTRRKGIDFVFLNRAFSLSCPILTIHKESPNLINDIKNLSAKNKFKINWSIKIDFPIKKSFKFHTTKLYYVKTILFFLIPE